MSLDFNLTRCDDTDYLYRDDIWPYTQSIIFATIALGIGDLTEDNYPEFIARLNIWNRICQLSFDEYPEDLVFKMIGLRVNVGFETRSKWMKRIVDAEMNDMVRAAKKRLVDA